MDSLNYALHILLQLIHIVLQYLKNSTTNKYFSKNKNQPFHFSQGESAITARSAQFGGRPQPRCARRYWTIVKVKIATLSPHHHPVSGRGGGDLRNIPNCYGRVAVSRAVLVQWVLRLDRSISWFTSFALHLSSTGRCYVYIIRHCRLEYVVHLLGLYE